MHIFVVFLSQESWWWVCFGTTVQNTHKEDATLMYIVRWRSYLPNKVIDWYMNVSAQPTDYSSVVGFKTFNLESIVADIRFHLCAEWNLCIPSPRCEQRGLYWRQMLCPDTGTVLPVRNTTSSFSPVWLLIIWTHTHNLYTHVCASNTDTLFKHVHSHQHFGPSFCA